MKLLVRTFCAVLVCGTLVAQQAPGRASIRQPQAVTSPNFPKSVRRAKAVYIAVYHDFGYRPPNTPVEHPGAGVKAVIRALTAWPGLRATGDAEIEQKVEQQLTSWGRFRVVRSLAEADLLVVLDKGYLKQVEAMCTAPDGSRYNCSGPRERNNSLSLYSLQSQPGLIWRGVEGPNTATPFSSLVPALRKEVEAAESSPTAPARYPSKLRLELLSSSSGRDNVADDHLTIRVWNEAETPLSFPKPNMRCHDPIEGFVKVWARVLDPRPDDGRKKQATVCFVDGIIGDVLARAADWITIAPSAYHDFSVPLLSLTAISEKLGSRYEIYASYHAPVLREQHLSLLEEHGIHAVQGEFEAAPVVIEHAASPLAAPGLPAGILEP